LTWDDVNKATLADGSECIFDVYRARVVWDRKPVRVFVDELDGEPLIGMGLLNGYELRAEVRSRGKVTVKRLR
jgi:predicted aspartyl protease